MRKARLVVSNELLAAFITAKGIDDVESSAPDDLEVWAVRQPPDTIGRSFEVVATSKTFDVAREGDDGPEINVTHTRERPIPDPLGRLPFSP